MEAEWIETHYLRGNIILIGQIDNTEVDYTLEDSERSSFYDLMDKHRKEIVNFAKTVAFKNEV